MNNKRFLKNQYYLVEINNISNCFDTHFMHFMAYRLTKIVNINTNFYFVSNKQTDSQVVYYSDFSKSFKCCLE